MDIRKYLTGGVKRTKPEMTNSSEEDEGSHQTTVKSIQTTSMARTSTDNGSSSSVEVAEPMEDDSHENDIGRYINKLISVEKKIELLKDCWVPSINYNFSTDATHLRRKFNFEWLKTYSPWLVYSKLLKGSFCKFCVLFPPKQCTIKGSIGSLMNKPFTRYKDIHQTCRDHCTNKWHKDATESARLFMARTPVDLQMQQHSQNLIEENKKIISSIISCITFSGTHDLPLRGKLYGEGIFEDLCRLRIDAGDEILKTHFSLGSKKASYRSVQIQNEIIDICGKTIRRDIIQKVRNCTYAILADETADISGKEQLSIGLRYYDETASEIKEEFVGFVELKALDARSIAKAIDDFVSGQELEPDRCVGLGFDGCSTMSGKEGGVQAVLRRKYKNALFFHCSSHKLNLVINDLNTLPEIRNTIGTIKDIITFFRESVLRRTMIPNIPALCETRWSEKYKVIRVFKKNLIDIVKALEKLSVEGNSATRKSAFQLHSAACRPLFLIAVIVIANYSEFLEPVVNSLQSVTIDIVAASQHLQRIISTFKNHRSEVESISEVIFHEASMMAEQLGSEMNIPRIVTNQQYRSNHPAASPSEFWRRSLVVPYLDSIISSLEVRFSQENTPAYNLTILHPVHMLKYTLNELKKNNSFVTYYGLQDGFDAELELWYQMWKEKIIPNDELQKMDVVDVLKECNMFFPCIKRALIILITLPCTTCTVERSFSSLRRIKTWLRSTMGEERLNGLAMMNIHREKIFEDLQNFTKKVVELFALNPRKLLLR